MRRLRIAIIADLTEAIPPPFYGGVERVVALVADGLRANHDVTLFATDDSTGDFSVVPYGHRTAATSLGRFGDLARLSRELLRRVNDFDIVHCFGRTINLVPVLPHKVIKIQTYGAPISSRTVKLAQTLARGTLAFTVCSRSCGAFAGPIADWNVVYNGVQLEKYNYVAEVGLDAPLVFLGRIDRVKGVHTAVRAAKMTGRKLIIAGNVAKSGENHDYFENEIKPEVDGENVVYIGPVNDEQKNQLLGTAAALLFPIEWEEPFGIVMAEALACGTPVIGHRRGAVPEVVEPGRNGFITENLEDVVSAIGCIEEISRQACRDTVEERFSADVITNEYVKLYQRLLNGGYAAVGN